MWIALLDILDEDFQNLFQFFLFDLEQFWSSNENVADAQNKNPNVWPPKEVKLTLSYSEEKFMCHARRKTNKMSDLTKKKQYDFILTLLSWQSSTADNVCDTSKKDKWHRQWSKSTQTIRLRLSERSLVVNDTNIPAHNKDTNPFRGTQQSYSDLTINKNNSKMLSNDASTSITTTTSLK